MTARNAGKASTGIIVLLGDQDDEGGLSAIAIARCHKVAELALDFPWYLILPTGGFGLPSQSERPHGMLLREYLITIGVDRDRIVPFTDSNNTVEHALFARRRIVDSGVRHVIVVTSDFNTQRASYIFQRIFPDFGLFFIGLPSNPPAPPYLLELEKMKLREIIDEWVDIPLYGRSEIERHFPQEIYHAASAEHKHYDIFSWTIIYSGFFIAFGFPYVARFEIGFLRDLAFVVSVISISVLCLMYNRMAWTARIARRVMHHIEAQYGAGFSLTYPRWNKSGWHLVRRGGSITKLVFATAVMLIFVQALALALLLAHQCGLISAADRKGPIHGLAGLLLCLGGEHSARGRTGVRELRLLAGRRGRSHQALRRCPNGEGLLRAGGKRR